MKTVQYKATLFYYDGPQIIEARDAIGGHYVGVLVDSDNGQRFLVTGAAPERLRQFRSGLLDLRALLIEGGHEDWYFAEARSGLEAPFTLERQTLPINSCEQLPESGFLLHERPTREETVREARERNNLVLEIAVEPPEAAEEHRIHASTLAGLLSHVQTVVKHAYAAAVRALSPEVRRHVDLLDSHLLDVVIPAGPGSFKVLLEASKNPDMFGQSELTRALERLDILFENAGNPQEALVTIKENRGHLAGAYLRLLKFLEESHTGFRYTWAEPVFTEPHSYGISHAEIEQLVDVLSGVSNLSSEQVVFDGKLEKADVVSGTWRLAANDGKLNGKLKDGGPSLAGLKIDGEYRFTCIEEIGEHDGTGRERKSLYLVEYEAL